MDCEIWFHFYSLTPLVRGGWRSQASRAGPKGRSELDRLVRANAVGDKKHYCCLPLCTAFAQALLPRRPIAVRTNFL